MGKIGFDNDIYLKMQSEKIKERISAFGGKALPGIRRKAF